MSTEVTLSLPERLVEDARRFGEATHRDGEEVLADTLEMLWPALGSHPDADLFPPVPCLSDAEVLALADAKMDAAQNERLGHLQAKGKASGLSEGERCELLALMQIYQLGQLPKSEALAEAVQRGLREPLPA